MENARGLRDDADLGQVCSAICDVVDPIYLQVEKVRHPPASPPPARMLALHRGRVQTAICRLLLLLLFKIVAVARILTCVCARACAHVLAFPGHADGWYGAAADPEQVHGPVRCDGVFPRNGLHHPFPGLWNLFSIKCVLYV